MVTIRLNDPDPAVLDGRNIRANAFEPAQRKLAAQLQRLFDVQPTIRRALTVNAGYSPLPTLLADHGFAVEGADSFAAAIEEAQTRHPFMPARRYRADRLRTPDQLSELCHVAGLDVERIVGYEPASAGTLITSLLARRRGRITDRELAARAGFRLSESDHAPPVTYYLVCRKHGERSGAE